MYRRASNPSSFRGLKPRLRVPWLGEYRLSVVRLGVLHSGKYLGIFQESRVPKKTVYSVRRRDPSRESEQRRAWNSHRQRVFRRQSNTPASRACRKKIYKGKMYGVRFPLRMLPRLCACPGHIFYRAHRESRPIISIFYFPDTREMYNH